MKKVRFVKFQHGGDGNGLCVEVSLFGVPGLMLSTLLSGCVCVCFFFFFCFRNNLKSKLYMHIVLRVS